MGDPHSKLLSILENREAGAEELLLQAVDHLKEEPALLQSETRERTLQALRRVRPAMAGFRNLAIRIEDHLETAADTSPEVFLREIHDEIQSAPDRLAEKFFSLVRLEETRRFVTLSWSSTVLRCLRRASDHIHELHVLESHPGGEGKITAEKAEAFVDQVVLHPDERLSSIIRHVDAGVIGADTVFRDNAVLNKVKSAPLGLELWNEGKPLFVVTTSWKFSDLRSDDFEIEEANQEWFEILRLRPIDKIVTEKGEVRNGDGAPI